MLVLTCVDVFLAYLSKFFLGQYCLADSIEGRVFGVPILLCVSVFWGNIGNSTELMTFGVSIQNCI